MNRDSDIEVFNSIIGILRAGIINYLSEILLSDAPCPLDAHLEWPCRVGDIRALNHHPLHEVNLVCAR